MKQTVEAIYEHGVFRPLQAPGVPEGQRVRLTVEAPPAESVDELLDLAAASYAGLSDEEITSVEEIACRRGDIFGERS
jgi:predicted DNA-binding antitoxin AbrB/MazE fold protein